MTSIKAGNSGGGGTPGGSDTQLQRNNAGAFGGVSGATSDGTSLTISSGNLKLSGASSGTVILNAPATGGGTLTLPAGTGTLLLSTGAVTSLAGTANQITASASTGAVTLSTPSDFRLPGTINLLTLTQPAAAATLTIANNSSLITSGANALTLTSTNTTNSTLPAGTHTLAGLDVTQTWDANQTVEGTTTTSPGWYAQLTGDSVPRVRVGLNATDVGSIAFGSGAGTRDLFLERAGAANLRHGGADSATPVAQLISTQNVLTGTSNTAGVSLTLAAGQGTGTGAGGSHLFQVAPASTTGSTQNALATVLTISPTGITQAGNVSAASWTTSGIKLIQSAATYTNTTSSGTVAAQYVNLFGAPTLAASSATTITNAYGTYFMDPVAGSNATLTNKWSLGADSLAVGGAAFKVLSTGATSIGSTLITTSTSTFANSAMTAGTALTSVWNSGGYTWSSTAVSTGTIDTTITRNAAGVVQIGASTGAAATGSLLVGTLPVAKTANYNVLAGDSRTAFNNTGAAGAITATLPTTAANQSYTFQVSAAQNHIVKAPTGTTMYGGGSASTSGGTFTSNTVGSSMTFLSINTTTIIATSMTGVWAAA